MTTQPMPTADGAAPSGPPDPAGWRVESDGERVRIRDAAGAEVALICAHRRSLDDQVAIACAICGIHTEGVDPGDRWLVAAGFGMVLLQAQSLPPADFAPRDWAWFRREADARAALANGPAMSRPASPDAAPAQAPTRGAAEQEYAA